MSLNPRLIQVTGDSRLTALAAESRRRITAVERNRPGGIGGGGTPPDLSNYVTLNTTQTLSGAKTFTSQVVASNNSTESFESRGSVAGYSLYDRGTGATDRWSIYATGGSIRLWRGSDVAVFAPAFTNINSAAGLTLDPTTGTTNATLTMYGRSGGAQGPGGALLVSPTGNMYFDVQSGLGHIFRANGVNQLVIQGNISTDLDYYSTGSIEARGPGGGGYVRLVPGNATQKGYIGWHKADGTRHGYMGWNNTDIALELENSAKFLVNGGPIWGTGLRVTGSGRTVWTDNVTNLWNVDNNAGTLRFFREDYNAGGSGANGAVRMSITDAGDVTIGGNILDLNGTRLSRGGYDGELVVKSPQTAVNEWAYLVLDPGNDGGNTGTGVEFRTIGGADTNAWEIWTDNTENSLRVFSKSAAADVAKFTVNGMSGTYITDGSLPASKLGFLMGGGNVLKNSGFEAPLDAAQTYVEGAPYQWLLYRGFPDTPGITTAVATGYSRGAGFGSSGLSIKRVSGGPKHAGIRQPLPTGGRGQTWTMSAWIRTPSGTQTASLYADWENADLSYGQSVMSWTVNSTWQRYTHTFTLPAGSTGGNFYVWIDNAADGAEIYVDDLQMESGGLTAYSPLVAEILPGVIVANMIQAGAVTAETLAATLTITGKTIKTAASGARVEMNGSNSSLDVYDASSTLRTRLGPGGLTFYDTLASPGLSLSNTGGLQTASSGPRTIVDLTGVSAYATVGGSDTLAALLSGGVGLALLSEAPATRGAAATPGTAVEFRQAVTTAATKHSEVGGYHGTYTKSGGGDGYAGVLETKAFVTDTPQTGTQFAKVRITADTHTAASSKYDGAILEVGGTTTATPGSGGLSSSSATAVKVTLKPSFAGNAITKTIIDSSGSSDFRLQHGFFVARTTSAQTVSNVGAGTSLTNTHKVSNISTTDANHQTQYDTSNSRFTPTLAGWYQFVVHFSFTNAFNTDVSTDIAVIKNNSVPTTLTTQNAAARFQVSSNGAIGPQGEFTVIMYMNGSSDYVELAAGCTQATRTANFSWSGRLVQFA